MKLFIGTIKEDFQDPTFLLVIDENAKEAKDNMASTIMEANDLTKEELEATFSISDIEEVNAVQGYKITLTKI